MVVARRDGGVTFVMAARQEASSTLAERRRQLDGREGGRESTTGEYCGCYYCCSRRIISLSLSRWVNLPRIVSLSTSFGCVGGRRVERRGGACVRSDGVGKKQRSASKEKGFASCSRIISYAALSHPPTETLSSGSVGGPSAVHSQRRAISERRLFVSLFFLRCYFLVVFPFGLRATARTHECPYP